MKDPAFLFYPGDYLRDTQCLSEAVQVAYDRIMCEHMRNICISPAQLNFFTKRLTPDEKSELDQVLKKVDGGFQIAWVSDSISKRRDYSLSRSQNRKGKTKEHMKNISTSYVDHMEIENEIENKDEIEKGVQGENQKSKPTTQPGEPRTAILIPEGWDRERFLELWKRWTKYKHEQFKFRYKSMDSEQTGINDLFREARGNFDEAVAMVNYTIGKGWKGIRRDWWENGTATMEQQIKAHNGHAESQVHKHFSTTPKSY